MTKNRLYLYSFLFGGIMAIFTGKTRRAHALNAIRAAIAIREQGGALNRDHLLQAPEVLVNIGINTGQVLLGATMIKGAVGQRFTYTASGMVTNIASRLCDLGSKGEIHLSATTALLVQDHFTLYGPCEVQLKNVQETISVYALDTRKFAESPTRSIRIPHDSAGKQPDHMSDA